MLALLNFTFYRVSQDLRSVMQYLIPEVIVSQICDVMVLICSCPRIVGIYNKMNKAEKKEVNCAFIEAMCVFRLFKVASICLDTF
jgi:hypothetical protein